jgi:hypothetical protein
MLLPSLLALCLVFVVIIKRRGKSVSSTPTVYKMEHLKSSVTNANGSSSVILVTGGVGGLGWRVVELLLQEDSSRRVAVLDMVFPIPLRRHAGVLYIRGTYGIGVITIPCCVEVLCVCHV